MAEQPIEIADLKKMIAELISSQQETRQQFAETDRRYEETRQQFAETDRRYEETRQRFSETDERIKRAFDLFEGQWGKLMESLVEGDLVRILNERGIRVESTSTRRKGRHDGEQYEFDIIAHNGGEVVIVEVKTTLRVKHVVKHIDRLEKAKSWLPEYKNFKVYGAVAYLRAEEESEVYAERQKLFAIRATGDSAAIINAPDFTPKAY